MNEALGTSPSQPAPIYTAWLAIHRDELTQIDAAIVARGGSIAERDEARHAFTNRHPYYEGVFTSPGVPYEAELSEPPTLTHNQQGVLCASFRSEERDLFPVREVVHSCYHRIVLVSTDVAVYVLTADEWLTGVAQVQNLLSRALC